MNVRDRSGDAFAAVLQVGPWLVVQALNQISRAGEVVRLEPKAVELLVYLAQRGGEVVSRDELLAALWPGVVVGDNALTQVVAKLRKALGDSVRQPRYIEAISKRGYRLIAPVERLERAGLPAAAQAVRVSEPPRDPPRRRHVAAALAAVVALIAAGAVWHFARTGDDDLASDVAQRASSSAADRLPMVIVQPIEAIGDDAGKLIARGLTSDLITDLSKSPGLWVVSGAEPRAAVAHEREPAARPAGRYALAGTVQSDGKTLRLDVRLSDADAGRPLWAHRYERGLGDLFAVQDELARSILEQLPVRVGLAQAAGSAQRYTRNVEAYQQFLRAQAEVQARQRSRNELARQLYWNAIELDPAFARAYAGLAMTHALAYQMGWEGEGALDKALQFAGTAQEMRPDMPEAHWALGFVETQRRQHAVASAHLRRALRLNPSYADAYALLGGIKTYSGQPAESVSLLRTALRLNPDAGSLYFLLLGRALYFVGEYQQARVNLEQTLARNAGSLEARLYLAAVLGELGDREGAVWQADEIRAAQPGFSVRQWLATYPMTDRRQGERLAQALQPLGL